MWLQYFFQRCGSRRETWNWNLLLHQRYLLDTSGLKKKKLLTVFWMEKTQIEWWTPIDPAHLLLHEFLSSLDQTTWELRLTSLTITSGELISNTIQFQDKIEKTANTKTETQSKLRAKSQDNTWSSASSQIAILSRWQRSPRAPPCLESVASLKTPSPRATQPTHKLKYLKRKT